MLLQVNSLLENPMALYEFVKMQLWVEEGRLLPFYSARLQHLVKLGQEVSQQQALNG